MVLDMKAFEVWCGLTKEERQARIDEGKAWRKREYPLLMNKQELEALKDE